MEGSNSSLAPITISGFVRTNASHAREFRCAWLWHFPAQGVGSSGPAQGKVHIACHTTNHTATRQHGRHAANIWHATATPHCTRPRGHPITIIPAVALGWDVPHTVGRAASLAEHPPAGKRWLQLWAMASSKCVENKWIHHKIKKIPYYAETSKHHLRVLGPGQVD
eukprot:gene4475-biopygen765